MMWKYILFDLDGTLTDSSQGITGCVAYALKKSGYSVPGMEALLEYIGPPLVRSFQELAGMPYDEACKAVSLYRSRYGRSGMFENIPYEGIEDVLVALKDKGKIMAVATSKPEEYAVKILEHFRLDRYFDEITGSTFDGSRNDKKSVIEESICRMGLSSADKPDIIMVGDRKHDITGAKECGIASLGVYYGFAKKGELEEAGADYITDSVYGIKELLL